MPAKIWSAVPERNSLMRVLRRSQRSTAGPVSAPQRKRNRNLARLPVALQPALPPSNTCYPNACVEPLQRCSAVPNGAKGPNTAGVENVVIIGSGPAGYTAAIYAARANLKPLVFEGVTAGGVRGGQLMTTTEVENFPGFPEGITGPDLMDRMRAQAERWGAELLTEDVVKVDTSVRPFIVESEEISVRAHTIIMATGATARRLGIPSEKEFWSRGISACAICDGASPLFNGQEVAVVGGGDSATEEAHYLTKYARHVHLLVRSESMRASKTMQDRVLQNPHITVHYNTEVSDAFGDADGLKGLELLDTSSGEKRRLELRGLFYGIGHSPNSKLVAGQVELDEAGYVVAQNGCETSVPGVFSAGDLHDTEWRQAVTAAGSGCMSAIAAERYLTANELVVEFHSAAAARSSTADAAASTSEEAAEPVPTVEAPFDITATRHKGQYALRKLYHETEKLIVVLYSSPTCGPCRSLKPMVNAVVEEFADQLYYVEIDIAEDPEIAEAAGVMGTPTVHCFKQKDRVENISGVKMKSEWRKLFGKYTRDADDSTPEPAVNAKVETVVEKEKITV